MKHFFIIANEQKDKELALTKQIQQNILSSGRTCGFVLNRKLGQEGYQRLSQEEVPNQTECILVLGGDGTLIRAARDMVSKNIPLIGVNMGQLGYLCELERSTVFSAIEQLFNDNYTIEKRMLLHGVSKTKDIITVPKLALNDVVIHRSKMLQIVNFIIYVNGEYLNTYSADGIIIATPTGSTAYSMSAGGPIVDPKADLILITPISPHSLNSKSIVLSAENEIIVEIGSRRMEHDEKVEVSFDGDQSVKLVAGDKIFIKKAKESVQILKLSKMSFLEILSKKMHGYT